MRGGTSKGPFFKASDLPSDAVARDAVLLEVMGSPHPLQVDGIGGSQPQTSKVAIISPSHRDDADIDYLFAQVMVDEARVDTNPNCGNMLSAVAPFAIEEGLFAAQEGTTKVRIHNVNTGAIIHSVVQTPSRKVIYRGEQQLDGVSGNSAPIYLHFLNAEGAKTGHFFPTGQPQELIDDTPVTLIDYSVPMMLINASDLGLRGDEDAEVIDKNTDVLTRIEHLRLQAGLRMGLGDVSQKVIPKVSILSPAKNGGTFTSRYLTPHSCHKSHAITGAMCLISSCYVAGTITADLLDGAYTKDSNITLEHPSGRIDLGVVLKEDTAQKKTIDSIAVVRTARRLFEGNVITQ
jgi:2-methylaconitate cis-trans-isomerase PrpF